MQTHQFNAEISKVLNLMINSLYTNREIFLRELIANAADACDKRRYLALQDANLQAELKITIHVDEEERTLSVSDNGIGMNEQDLINCLGVIAASGTEKFIASYNASKENLIGQFGVGFYSIFMVADKVEVLSRKLGEDIVYKWLSDGTGTYTVGEVADFQEVGTTVKLHLKADADEYLDKYRLRHIITTYADHIAFPIHLADEVVNTSSALWARDKKQITDEQYQNFYQHIAHLPDSPWMKLHYNMEGMLSYNTLLYIPSIKPFDLFHPDRPTSVKLYVQKVFITENAPLIPNYLRFLRGVVDAVDLPLNVSRETLQRNQIVDKIRKSIVKKILSELRKKMSESLEEYTKFWQNFGEVVKEGLCEHGLEEKEELLGVCRFYSTAFGAKQTISLDEYVARMLPKQQQIFYLTGDNIDNLQKHPQLEGFIRRGIEVILLADHVDDFWVHVIHAYKDKSLVCVNNHDIKLNDIAVVEEDESVNEIEHSEILKWIKEQLGDLVKDVVSSQKLINSPACLAIAAGNMSSRMEKYLIEQKQLAKASKKNLEVNLQHPLLQKVMHNLDAPENRDIIKLIFYQACMIDGAVISDQADFLRCLNDTIEKAYL